MVTIALIPNLIPQILTAAFMGYFGIPIKPSTIIIFSIALGISADNTILFLSRFRMELKSNNDNIKLSVYKALSETAHSMIYSSTILFFGFTVFILSSFGGTQSLGKLISFTLLMAMLANLILLPALLLSLDKRMAYKLAKEPLWEVYEEENLEGNIDDEILLKEEKEVQNDVKNLT
jgi:predicted RND superfamily exporter protein